MMIILDPKNNAITPMKAADQEPEIKSQIAEISATGNPMMSHLCKKELITSFMSNTNDFEH